MEPNTEQKSPLQELIDNLEVKRGTKILMLTMDGTRSIDRYMVSQIYDMIIDLENKKEIKDLDIIINSFGGDADAAFHISKILHKHCNGKLTFIVPRFAKSAATLMCCAGDSIIMDEPSELGPVDPQITDSIKGERYSALSIKDTMLFLDKIEKECNNDNSDCNNVIREAIKNIPLMEIGDNLRALNHISEYLEDLLKMRMFKEEIKINKEEAENNIKNIVLKLREGHYSHSRCIDYESAKDMGLKIEKVDKDDWKIIWKIFKIFEEEVLIK